MKYRHLPEIVMLNAQLRPEATALASRANPLTPQVGDYVCISHAQFYHRACEFGVKLLALGLKKGDRIAILSNNCPEWAIADIGSMMAGIINVPIYPTLSAAEVAYILQDSQAKWVVHQTDEHKKILKECAKTIPDLQTLSVKKDFATRRLSKENREKFESKIKKIKGDDIATIVYTSGTTGTPKGVMLTHNNILSNVHDLIAVTPLTEEDRALSLLPLSHVFERTVGYYTPLSVGAAIYYAQHFTTVPQDLSVAKPSIVISVPRLYEKIREKMVADLTGIKKWLWFFPLTRKLIQAKVAQKLGGRLRFFVSGGAPLSQEVAEFFQALGLIIIEGYGLTETAPVIACNRLTAFKFGTVGKVLPSQEVKLSDDQELMIRGPNVSQGYWQHPEWNSDLLESDGWCHTGDIAQIDEEGFITIVDREKELMVLSTGKKVAPQAIEKQILASHLVSQFIIIGEQKKYLTGLLVPNFSGAAKHLNLDYTVGKEEAFISATKVQEFYDKLVQNALGEMANFEKVKRITLLPKEFSQESGEITPTLKLKRKVILENHQKAIAAMYEKGKDE